MGPRFMLAEGGEGPGGRTKFYVVVSVALTSLCLVYICDPLDPHSFTFYF